MASIQEDFEALDLDAIRRYIDTEQEEHLSLEFKRVSSDDLSAGEDRRRLAEALSGFGNADGGLVVWGVETKRDKARHVEVAASLREIGDVAAFVGRLNEFTGSFVHPRIEGVRHKKIVTAGTKGVAVSLVPRSDAGPHMAKAGLDQYIRRHGDRFLTMEHYEVEEMFGRQLRPVLTVTYQVEHGQAGSGWKEANVDLVLQNAGRGSASAPYVDIKNETPADTNIKAEGVTRDGLSLMQMLWSRGLYLFLGRSDLVIHPAVEFTFARLTYRIWLHGDGPKWRDVRLVCRTAAEGARLNEQTIAIPWREMATVLGFQPE